MKQLIVPAAVVACTGLAACSTTPMQTSQSLAPTPAINGARAMSSAPLDEASGNAEDGAKSLAYEVESGTAPKQSRLKKKSDKQARLQPAGVQSAVIPVADAADTVGDPPLPLTAMLPETRPTSPLLAAEDAPARPVQVASLDPSIGVSAERFGFPPAPQIAPGEAGARLQQLDRSAPPAAPGDRIGPASVEARSSELDQLMAHYAGYYKVPVELVRRVAKRESTLNPRATNGAYLGLMQISLPTARGMGYRGDRKGLLDAETNLKYAVRYLRGAYLVARGDHDRADRLYQTGYYYHAKRAGLLDETGVGRDRKRRSRL